MSNLFPWRAPLRDDWFDQWSRVDGDIRAAAADQPVDAQALCLDLRRLTGQQLGDREQLKLEGSARRLAKIPALHRPFKKFRLGLIGNRTLSFLVNPLRVAGFSRGLLVDAVEAPFGAVERFAFDAPGLFGTEDLDAVVVILDMAAFARSSLLDDAGEEEAVDAATALLKRLADSARSQFGATTIIASIPAGAVRISSSDAAIAGCEARLATRINRAVALGAADRQWLMWDLADLAARIGRDTWCDPVRLHQAKTPFRIDLCPLVADHLCRILAAMVGQTCRALVLDLDNTVWGGVVGDDGVAGLRLGQNSPEGEAFVEFQRFALDLRNRGVVLAVCSKNSEALAREAFRVHPEMLIKESHIAVFQANWDDKASNILAISEALNLGLDALAFADDNPAERERVRQELPLVNVPEIGSDPAFFAQLIADSGAFEHLVLNADDLIRSQTYECAGRRAELKTRIGNYAEYLASLKMVLTVSRFDSMGRARITQLINKSNQFNLTTRRYNEEDVRHIEEDRESTLCWQARLDDNFGPQGIVSIVILRKSPSVWTIDTWLMSCRVLARGVESALMNLLMQEALAAGVAEVVGEYIPTSRNGLVADFYPRHGFVPVENCDGRMLFVARPAEWTPMTTFIAVK